MLLNRKPQCVERLALDTTVHEAPCIGTFSPNGEFWFQGPAMMTLAHNVYVANSADFKDRYKAMDDDARRARHFVLCCVGKRGKRKNKMCLTAVYGGVVPAGRTYKAKSFNIINEHLRPDCKDDDWWNRISWDASSNEFGDHFNQFGPDPSNLEDLRMLQLVAEADGEDAEYALAISEHADYVHLQSSMEKEAMGVPKSPPREWL